MRNYVEHVWPHLERQGGVPETPMNRASKGSSNPPVSDWVLGLMESNKVASYYLGWALSAVEEEAWESLDGVPYSAILKKLREDPGALTRWRDEDDSSPYFRNYYQMCYTVAKGVLFVHGRTDKERAELERRLNLDPDYRSKKPDGSDNPEDPEDGRHALVVRRHPLDEEESRGRTRQGQKIDTMHTRRLMVEQLEQLEASTDYTGLAAMEVLRERKAKEGKDWSVEKLRHARKAVNRERSGGEGEVA